MDGASFRPALPIATGANSPIPLETARALTSQAFRRLLKVWRLRPARRSLITPLLYCTRYITVQPLLSEAICFIYLSWSSMRLLSGACCHCPMSQKHSNTTLAILKESQRERQKRGASGVSRKPRSRLWTCVDTSVCYLVGVFPIQYPYPRLTLTHLLGGGGVTDCGLWVVGEVMGGCQSSGGSWGAVCRPSTLCGWPLVFITRRHHNQDGQRGLQWENTTLPSAA